MLVYQMSEYGQNATVVIVSIIKIALDHMYMYTCKLFEANNGVGWLIYLLVYLSGIMLIDQEKKRTLNELEVSCTANFHRLPMARCQKGIQ